MKHHHIITWDTSEGRDAKHLICTENELSTEVQRIRNACLAKGLPLWFLSTSRADNPAPGGRESIIEYTTSSLTEERYSFTGTQTDLYNEIDWLKANGALTVYSEDAEPELPAIHTERIQLVRAMELLARAVNDETVFDLWLSLGVADGDIDENTPDEYIEDYCYNDVDFADLMDTFLKLMARANKSGGLYCDGITSGEAE